MRKIAIILLLVLGLSLVCQATVVQSGWIKWNSTTSSISAGTNEYWIFVSQSENAQIGRDGTVSGAYLRLQNASSLTGLGFGVLRLTSTANTYLVVGKSAEITSGIVNGVNTFTFTPPITNVYSTDILALWAKSDGNSSNQIFYNPTASTFPIQDTTSTIKWFDDNNGVYTNIDTGETFLPANGGTIFGVVSMCPLMDSPDVIGVGDSIAMGAPLNYSYRANQVLTKNRISPFMAVMYRNLGWTYENAAIGGDTAAGVISKLDAQTNESMGVWGKQPKYLHVHVGVNDLNTGRTLAQYLADLDTIKAQCDANNCKMIISAIFPWTGAANNSTGTAAQNTMRDAWNISLLAWAKLNGVYFLNANDILGQERLVAKSGDGAPTAGNKWDLKTKSFYAIEVAWYDASDGPGVHLSEAGAAAAGSALAVALDVSITQIPYFLTSIIATDSNTAAAAVINSTYGLAASKTASDANFDALPQDVNAILIAAHGAGDYVSDDTVVLAAIAALAQDWLVGKPPGRWGR